MPADSRGPSCPWARRQGVVAWGSLSQPAPATVGPTTPPPPRRAGTSLRWGRDGVQARGRALISGWGRSTGPPSAGRSKRLPVQDKGCALARWQRVPPAAGRVAGSPGVGGSVTMPLPRSHVLEFASGPHWLALPTAWSLSLCTHGPRPRSPPGSPPPGASARPAPSARGLAPRIGVLSQVASSAPLAPRLPLLVRSALAASVGVKLSCR